MLKDPDNPSPEEGINPRMLSPKEAADYLGLHIITVYRLIKKGELPAFKVGGQWRFKSDLLDDWIVETVKKHKRSA